MVRIAVIALAAASIAGCAGPRHLSGRAADFTAHSAKSLDAISACLAANWDPNVSVELPDGTAYSVLKAGRVTTELYVHDEGASRAARLYVRSSDGAAKQSEMDRVGPCL